MQIIIADLVQPIVETAVLHQHRAAPGDNAHVKAAAAAAEAVARAAAVINSGNATGGTGGGGGASGGVGGGFDSPWAFVATRGFITACSFAVVYPLTLARSVSALGAASSAAFVILLAVAAALVVRFLQVGTFTE